MFYSDKPIQSSEDDELDRSGFAHMLAETLLNMEEIKDTFSVGLYGKWGSGKTSIVNIKDYVTTTTYSGKLDKLTKYVARAFRQGISSM